AGDDADRIAGFESATVVGSDGAPRVGDGRDLDALGDDDLEDGVGGHAAGHRNRDGAHAGDLAVFLVNGVASDEGVVVDEDVDRRLRTRRPVGASGGAGQVDQGVGPVGIVPLVPSAGHSDATSAISLTWASDSHPPRKAAAVPGRSSSSRSVSIAEMAGPTGTPALAAIHAAAERKPAAIHRSLSTERAAIIRTAAP